VSEDACAWLEWRPGFALIRKEKLQPPTLLESEGAGNLKSKINHSVLKRRSGMVWRQVILDRTIRR